MGGAGTGAELAVVLTLASRAGQIVARHELAAAIRGRRDVAVSRAVDVHVARVRRKLASLGASAAVATLRGAGYVWALPSAAGDRSAAGAGPAGALHVDRQARRALVDGRPLPLTGLELELLVELTRHAGRAVARADLARATCAANGSRRGSIDVHVHRLRRKLEAAGAAAAIETVRGEGYSLRPLVASAPGA